MADQEDVKRGIDVATGFIAYRMRSEYEVRRRLKRAQLSDEDIVAVIAQLKDMRLIDDRAFAGAYTRDYMLGKQRGPVRVRKGLLTLGVSKDLAAEAIQEVLSEHDPFLQAMALGEKRWMKLREVKDRTARKKRVYEFLLRRGYEFSDARRVVDKLERGSE